jgi:photosystem II stability/assembly factor-like uncharacterized protein
MNDPGRELSRLLHTYAPEPDRPLSYDALRQAAERRQVRQFTVPALIGLLVVIMLAGTVFGVRAFLTRSGSHSSAAIGARTSVPQSTSASPSTTNAVSPLAGFTPSSVASASGDLWLAGMQRCGAQTCPTVAHSADAGKTWQKLAAPQADLNTAEAVFADQRNGWIIAVRAGMGTGALYATHDGGRSWHSVGLADVAHLATSGDKVWATVRTPSEAYSLYRASTGSDQFSKLADTSGVDIVAQNGTAYVWNFGGYSGARIPPSPDFGTFTAAGTSATAFPCTAPYLAQVVLAVDQSGHLFAVCGTNNGATGNELKRLYESRDSGNTWTALGALTNQGSIASLAVEGNTLLLTGQRMPIASSIDAGRHWTAALSDVGGASGFSRPVLTDTRRGYVTGGGGMLYATRDGGRTWQLSLLR